MILRQKVLTFSLSEWNHPLWLVFLSPVFVFIGGTVGYLGVSSHVGSSQWLEMVQPLSMVGALFLGSTFLAVIDANV